MSPIFIILNIFLKNSQHINICKHFKNEPLKKKKIKKIELVFDNFGIFDNNETLTRYQ